MTFCHTQIFHSITIFLHIYHRTAILVHFGTFHFLASEKMAFRTQILHSVTHFLAILVLQGQTGCIWGKRIHIFLTCSDLTTLPGWVLPWNPFIVNLLNEFSETLTLFSALTLTLMSQ